MDAATLQEIAEQWSLDLARIPITRLFEVTNATITGATYPPQMADFGARWDAIYAAEVAAYNAEAWKREDEEKREKLPQLTDFAGGSDMSRAPLFAQTFDKFGGAVVCNCEGDRWGGVAAELNAGNTHWVCKSGRCAFSMPVSELKAPEQTPAEEAPAAPLLPPCEYSGDELLVELELRCGFRDAFSNPRALPFARFFEKNVPVDMWTVNLARQQWATWQQSARQEAQAATG